MVFLVNLSELQFLLEYLPQSELTECFEESKRKGKYLAKGKHVTGKYCLEISNEQVEMIQEQLSILLTDQGLSTDGEPNTTGFLIENMIDLFEENI